MKKEKGALRKKIIQERDRFSKQEVSEKSASIAKNLYALSVYREANAVMFFISFGSEVDTRLMIEDTIQRGKLALAPKAVPETRALIPSQIIDWMRDLEPGAYNIPEPGPETLRPRDPEIIDLLIVPGVGFDLDGGRLGYGGGYYDRFFELLKPGVPLVALAFEMQIIPDIPLEQWDRRVDMIITEQRVITRN